jgi:hypothetical protein
MEHSYHLNSSLIDVRAYKSTEQSPVSEADSQAIPHL